MSAWQQGGSGAASPLIASGRAFEAEGLGTRISPSPARNEGLSFARMTDPYAGSASAPSYKPPSLMQADPMMDIGSSHGGSPPRWGASDALVIRLENGGFVEVPYNPAALGEDVKAEVEVREAIEARRQRLYTSDNTEIEDYAQLEANGVQPGSQLFLRVDASPRRFSDNMAAHGYPDRSAVATGVREIIIKRPTGTEPIGLSFDSDMMITDMDPTGLGAESGVIRRMKVLAVNGTPVSTTTEFKKQATLGPNDLPLLVLDAPPVPRDAYSPQRDASLYYDGPQVDEEQVAAREENAEAVIRHEEADAYQRGFINRWFVNRFCLAFLVFISLGIGLGSAVVAGDSSHDDCDKIDNWAMAMAVLMFILPIGIAAVWFNLHRRGLDIFDYTNSLSVVLLSGITLHVFVLIVMSIVALVILTRDMNRTERDTCSDFRDLVVFVVVVVCTVFSTILCLLMVRYTHETNVDAKQKQIKAWRARTAQLPSNQPRDYQQDLENPKVPLRYV